MIIAARQRGEINNGQLMRSIDILRTRSYKMQPIATIARGVEWMVRSLVGSTTTYEVSFGIHRFKLKLQAARRGFGSGGIFIQRRYYEPLLEFGYKLLSAGDRVIDGGANQGIFTCAFAAAVGNSGHVYAFEPQSYAVSCIHRNVALNSLTNVTVFEGALSDEAGDIFLVMDLDPVSAFTTLELRGTNTARVKALTIDDLANSHQVTDIQFVKLDVEGSELRALRGARSMVRRSKPRICIEALDKKLYEQIAEFLSPFGYKPYVFDDHGNLNHFTTFSHSPNVFFLF
jgi:FkbM family methyltransferase